MLRRTKGTGERGFTLLEYCAGAAVVASVIWLAFNELGTNIRDLMQNIGGWAKARGDQVTNSK